MDDDAAIRALIGAHFEPMRWDDSTAPDWDRFRADFHEGAVLCGALRPAHPRGVEGFIERMETMARKTLASFEEHTKGMQILRFGNVAVVLAMSELTEDGREINHDISAYLLVKSEGRWSILGHAWDQASTDNPVPAALRG